jgi:hypothetical protein
VTNLASRLADEATAGGLRSVRRCFEGMLAGAIAAILGIAGVAGNHAFTPQLWAIVGLAGAVAIASLVVGARLLRRGRDSRFRGRA